MYIDEAEPSVVGTENTASADASYASLLVESMRSVCSHVDFFYWAPVASAQGTRSIVQE